MATPRYFHFYDMPEFDARYGTDPALTRRCDSVATSLYKLLTLEVKFLRTVPADCMDSTLWDLCHCAGLVVDSIPFDGWTIEASCERESPQFYKLARRFIEYNVTGQAVRTKLESLTQYVMQGQSIESLEAVS
jgi:hypothetical protein